MAFGKTIELAAGVLDVVGLFKDLGAEKAIKSFKKLKAGLGAALFVMTVVQMFMPRQPSPEE